MLPANADVTGLPASNRKLDCAISETEVHTMCSQDRDEIRLPTGREFAPVQNVTRSTHREFRLIKNPEGLWGSRDFTKIWLSTGKIVE
jgi:hypothetical protein